jgi:hypothetical protein
MGSASFRLLPQSDLHNSKKKNNFAYILCKVLTRNDIIAELYTSKQFRRAVKNLFAGNELWQEMVSFICCEVLMSNRYSDDFIFNLYRNGGMIEYCCKIAYNQKARPGKTAFWKMVRPLPDAAELSDITDIEPDEAEPVEITAHEHTLCLMFHGVVTPEAVSEVRSRSGKKKKEAARVLDVYLQEGTMRKAAEKLGCGHVTVHNKIKLMKST